jgi:predicted transposase YbfD/YdcC
MEKSGVEKIKEYFKDVDTTEEHNGYSCSVGETLTIVILGSICGLRNVSQIQQWASSTQVAGFLSEKIGIAKIPCYYWMLCLLKLIKPESLNQCFSRWVESLLPNGVKKLTVSFDGKTIRSTGKMVKNEKALHIISAHIAELGLTFGQRATDSKSNEIPAVRELIKQLCLDGCIVVADALNCQKETAKAIIEAKADYLLSVKENQSHLKESIADYISDEQLRNQMDSFFTIEKQSGRIEKRNAFVTNDVEWLYEKSKWPGLVCVGGINTQFTTPKGTSNEWHYYISSRELTADELLKHARLEWSVESMHWLLDVHFGEDFCRIEDLSVQKNLNITRKIALNLIKKYKQRTESKRALSKIMFDCLLDYNTLLAILEN